MSENKIDIVRIMNTLNSVINKEINFFRKRTKKTTNKFKYFKKTGNIKEQYTILSWNYIWSYFQAIDRMYNRQDTIEFPIPNFSQIIYMKAVDPDNSTRNTCSGHVRLYIGDGFMKGDGPNIFLYNANETLFNDFLNKFFIRVKNCIVGNLDITIEVMIGEELQAHANTVFVYKDNQENVILAWYEPHGAQAPFQFQREIHDKVNNFLQHLAARYTLKFRKNVTILNKDITCPVGLQHYEPGEGYCLMYSYFWIYMVFKCFMAFEPYITDQQNIQGVLSLIERRIDFVIRERGDPISDIIYIFAIFLLDSYMEILHTKYPRLVKTVLANIRGDMYTSIEKYKIEKTELKHNSSEEKKEERSRELKEKEEKKKKVKKEEKEEKEEKKIRKSDDQVCDNNDDCLSDLCVNRKCVSREQYLQLNPRKKNNSPCIEHGDCKSGLCAVGKCRKYMQYYPCESNDQCESDLCMDGYCQIWHDRKIGETCLEDSECISNLCIDGKCLPGRDYGNYYPLKNPDEKCFRSHECVTEKCENNVCIDYREPLY